ARRLSWCALEANVVAWHDGDVVRGMSQAWQDSIVMADDVGRRQHAVARSVAVADERDVESEVEGPAARRVDTVLRLHAGDDETLHAAPMQLGLERGAVKRVGGRLADHDLARGRRDVRVNLPGRRSFHERGPARVMVLHVNDRNTGRAGTA